MRTKGQLAKPADFTTRVLLDREAQTSYVKGIVEFPNRIPQSDQVYASVASIVQDEFKLSRADAIAALAVRIGSPCRSKLALQSRCNRCSRARTGHGTRSTSTHSRAC